MKMRKYFIKTYGCQMNLADSEKLAGVLGSAGYREAKAERDADLILVNTCVVRQNAENRAAGYVSSLKGLKEKNPSLKIGLCGCFVTEPGREVKKQFPHVDLFIPPNNSEKLAEYLNSPFVISHSSFKDSDLVTIMHGCDNFCAYCVVPYVRGREYSRPMDEVLKEIEELLNFGIKKITLLGQNVNSYKYGLAELLRKIEKLISRKAEETKSRVHFLTSHPRDMSDEIIEAVHELPYVAKEFVMPLQSGDDEILKKMNRGYTMDYYMNRVSRIRSLMPKARITTDLLVGFPGETEEQFHNTLRAVELIKFNEAHMFAYSDRPNTAASKMPHKVPEETKKQRLKKLIEVVRKHLV